jgi:hypothetical protein
MHEANLGLKQLFFLGLDSDEMITRAYAVPQIYCNWWPKKS